MLIGPAEIAALLPHAGAMCLIESVELCGDDQIICLTTTHLAAANPLRRHGRLGIMAGVEYASQAMALHAALQSQGPATRGYLASLRAVTLYTDRLDPVDGPPGGSGAIAESFGGHRQPVIVMAGSGGGSASPGALPPNPVMAGEGPPSTPCCMGLGKGVDGGPSPAMTGLGGSAPGEALPPPDPATTTTGRRCPSKDSVIAPLPHGGSSTGSSRSV